MNPIIAIIVLIPAAIAGLFVAGYVMENIYKFASR